MKLPEFEPMLATPWPKAFNDEAWWFEVKWDGYRAVVGSAGGRIRARSRRGLDLLDRFPELASIDIPEGVVVDGEVVAFDQEGRPSFAALQGGGPVNLVAYDILFRGEDLTTRPYMERRSLLEALELASPIVVPEATPETGVALFDAVSAQGLEGVVGKRVDSRYIPGKRSHDWRKIAVRRRLRALVGGYLPGEGSRSATFGSVLVGLHTGEGLRWIGAVGSGFDEASLAAFHGAMASLGRPTSPFVDRVTLPGQPVWVEPVIVIGIEYKEWTRDHRLRAPVFKGLESIDPGEVTWETEGPT